MTNGIASAVFLIGACLALNMAVQNCAARDALETRPNVILILADDLAVGDSGGSERGRCRTPNLDKPARQSVRFQRAYSGSCVCAPARAALLTGRYPHRTGVVTLNMNRFPELTQYDAARRKAQSGEYQQVRKQHPAVERKPWEMAVRHGSRRARSRGQQQQPTGIPAQKSLHIPLQTFSAAARK